VFNYKYYILFIVVFVYLYYNVILVLLFFILKVKLGSLLNEEKKGVNDGSASNSIDDADNLNGSDDGSVNGEVFSVQGATGEKALFSDDLTTSMFGGEVEVAVDNSLAEQLDEASFVTLPKDSSGGRFQKPEMTPFDRAMKKAKHIMHVKAIDKRNKVS
jgi:hypothetical protein